MFAIVPSVGSKCCVGLPPQVQALFRVEHGEVHSIRTPTQQERRRFFEDLILFQAAKAPASKKKACES